MLTQSATQPLEVIGSDSKVLQAVSYRSHNMIEAAALACFQGKHIVLFEKEPHTSYGALLASIIRIMLHEVQNMAAGLMHDHVVIEVSSKHRKTLLDTSHMV